MHVNNVNNVNPIAYIIKDAYEIVTHIERKLLKIARVKQRRNLTCEEGGGELNQGLSVVIKGW